MKSVQAWAPGNISLLFKVMPDPDPSKAGSLGSGFTVNEGACVTVKQDSVFSITLNGQPVELPTVVEVLSKLTPLPLAVAIETPLPLGSGFGISGAAALSSAHAVNTLLSLGKSDHELAVAAHTAEVIHKTGLGDVGNQWKGGCCVKFITSSLFQMERLPFAGTPVYVASWGKIPTPSILGNPSLLRQIDEAGSQTLALLRTRIHQRGFTFPELLDISLNFAKRSGLLAHAKRAERVIESVRQRGGHATMIILGDAVISDIPFEGSRKLHVTETGVKLLKTTA